MRVRAANYFSFKAGIALASLITVFLGGCSGGLSDIHSISSLSFMGGSAPAEKPKTDQPINAAEIIQPGTLADIAIGQPNAPVTIVEYVSLGCVSCPGFHSDSFPKLKKAFIDKGKVHYILREFPEDQASTSMAQAARCVPEKDYFTVVEKLLKHQKEWMGGEIKKDALYALVKSTGVKRDKFEACLADQTIANGLVSAKERGKGFGVTVSPTFFVNGKKVAGAVSYDELKGVVEAALVVPAAPATAQPQQPAAPQQGAPKSS